jgi:hypothetical protein
MKLDQNAMLKMIMLKKLTMVSDFQLSWLVVIGEPSWELNKAFQIVQMTVSLKLAL